MGLFDGLYAALGASPDASVDDLKKAFRQVARTCHPDVAGDDPEKARRFKAAREAYEVLTDPARRAAFEASVHLANAASAGPSRPRKKARDAEDHGAFFRAFYKRASGGAAGPPPPTSARAPRTSSATDDFFGVGGEPDPFGDRATRARASGPGGRGEGGGPRDVRAAWRERTGGGNGEGADFLDDLFRDFGYGGEAPPSGATRAAGSGPEPGRARRGDDVILDLDVPAALCARGGMFPARYVHLVRDEGWRSGDAAPGVLPRHDAVELDIPAGTKHAAIRRYRGLGDAGPWGGPAGDLVVRVRVLDAPYTPGERQEPGPSGAFEADADAGAASRGPRPSAERAGEPDLERRTLDLSVPEALLGARVEVSTPQGRVRMSIPPCTSTGATFRLRGRGAAGADGAPRDLLLEARILAPAKLDDASRELIEAFARLNPESPER
jgi:DnaJ-class molecular chaperone